MKEKIDYKFKKHFGIYNCKIKKMSEEKIFESNNLCIYKDYFNIGVEINNIMKDHFKVISFIKYLDKQYFFILNLTTSDNKHAYHIIKSGSFIDKDIYIYKYSHFIYEL